MSVHTSGSMEARGEKINASSGLSKEIAGLKKMKMMMMMMMMMMMVKMTVKMMTPGSQIRVCRNSRMKGSRYVGALWAYV